MIADALDSLLEVLSPPFRKVLWKSLGLTFALLIFFFFVAQAALGFVVDLSMPWLETAISIVAGLGLAVGLGFLIAPATSAFAGLFLDEIAEEVEQTNYPHEAPGQAMPLGASIMMALKFLVLVIAVNIGVLFLLLLPGINIAAFFLANGYLLGREYFEFAARRFRGEADTEYLRRSNSGTVFMAGLVIACVLAVPVLNLITPLFATAFMVRVHKRMTGSLPVDRLATSRS